MICRSVGRSVCLSVRTRVRPVHCGKTADRIRMPFGIIGRTGPGMRQVVEFGDLLHFYLSHTYKLLRWFTGSYKICNSTERAVSVKVKADFHSKQFSLEAKLKPIETPQERCDKQTSSSTRLCVRHYQCKIAADPCVYQTLSALQPLWQSFLKQR